MQRSFLTFLVLAITLSAYSQPEPNRDELTSKKITLPNGWSLTPAGHAFTLGDLPLNIAVSPSGNRMAVTNNGQSTQTIQLIDVGKEQVLDSIVIPKSWLGLKFSG